MIAPPPGPPALAAEPPDLDAAPVAERAADDVFLDQIKYGYYQLADKHSIVGVGPELNLASPHDRARLPGKGVWLRAS